MTDLHAACRAALDTLRERAWTAPAVIAHVEDVLTRHSKERGYRAEDAEFDEETGEWSAYGYDCGGCGFDSDEEPRYLADDCPEVRSVAALLGVETTGGEGGE